MTKEELKLPKTALPIEDAIDHWVDADGSVYALDKRKNHKNKLIKKAQSKAWDYKYCGIRYRNKTGEEITITKRVHRLVAEAFIPNPNNYKVIGHKNNIKSDNRVENLYWTTIKENTQKAFDDRLIKNDKGIDDSQSKPVYMFETITNNKLGEYGSCREAAEKTGIPLTTICRQAKYHRPTRKDFYFRYSNDEDCIEPVIGMFDYDSDKLLKTFINASDAAKQTGISNRTISQQVQLNKKPSRKTNSVYFIRIHS